MCFISVNTCCFFHKSSELITSYIQAGIIEMRKVEGDEESSVFFVIHHKKVGKADTISNSKQNIYYVIMTKRKVRAHYHGNSKPT